MDPSGGGTNAASLITPATATGPAPPPINISTPTNVAAIPTTVASSAAVGTAGAASPSTAAATTVGVAGAGTTEIDLDADDSGLSVEELGAKIAAQRATLKRLKQKLERRKEADAESEAATLQSRMRELDAEAERDLNARLEAEEAAKLLALKVAAQQKEETELSEAIEELERRAMIEVAANKKSELDDAREKRVRIEALLWNRSVMIESIVEERKTRDMNDIQKLDKLLTKADLLQKELNRKDDYSVAEKANIAASILTPNAADSDVAEREVMESILAKRRRRHDASTLEAEEKIRRLNEERRQIALSYSKLNEQKLSHSLILQRGNDFAVEVELGAAPPLSFLLKNRSKEELEKLNAYMVQQQYSRSAGMTEGDEDGESGGDPYDNTTFNDDDDIGTVVDILKRKLPDQTRALERLKASFNPPIKRVLPPYSGEWGVHKYAPDKRPIAAMLRSMLTDTIIPNILSTNPLFNMQPTMRLSDNELTSLQMSLNDDKQRFEVEIESKMNDTVALQLSRLLLDQIVEEMAIDILKECYKLHRLACSVTNDIIVDSCLDTAKPVDRSSLIGAYEEMRRRRERWLNQYLTPPTAVPQQIKPLQLPPLPTNPNDRRFQHTGVLVTTAEVMAEQRRGGGPPPQSQPWRRLIDPSDLDEPNRAIAMNLPVPKFYEELCATMIGPAGSSVPPAFGIRAARNVVEAEREYWQRFMNFECLSITVPAAQYNVGGFTVVKASIDGRYLAAGTERGGLFVWSLKDLSIGGDSDAAQPTAIPPPPLLRAEPNPITNTGKPSPVVSLNWSVNNSQIISIDGRGVITVWELGFVSSHSSIAHYSTAAPSLPPQNNTAANNKKSGMIPSIAAGPRPVSTVDASFPVVSPFAPITSVFRLSMSLTYPHASLFPTDPQKALKEDIVPIPTRAVRLFAGDFYRPAVNEAPLELGSLQPLLARFHPAITFTAHQPSVMIGLACGLLVKWNISDAGGRTNPSMVYGALPVHREPPIPPSVAEQMASEAKSEQSRRRAEWEREVDAAGGIADRKNEYRLGAEDKSEVRAFGDPTASHKSQPKPLSTAVAATKEKRTKEAREKASAVQTAANANAANTATTAKDKSSKDAKTGAALSSAPNVESYEGLSGADSEYAALHPDRWISPEQQREEMSRIKQAFIRGNTDYIKREFFQSHKLPVIMIDFLSLPPQSTSQPSPVTAISLDTGGLLKVWPYTPPQFSGFGWFVPERTYRIDVSMLAILPIVPEREEEVLFSAIDDSELKRVSKGYIDSAAFQSVRNRIAMFDENKRSRGQSYTQSFVPMMAPLAQPTDLSNRLHTFVLNSAGLIKKHMLEPFQLLRISGEVIDAKLTANRKDLLIMIRYRSAFNCGLEYGFPDSPPADDIEQALEAAEIAAEDELFDSYARQEVDLKADTDTPIPAAAAAPKAKREFPVERDSYKRRRQRARRKLKTDPPKGSDFVRIRVIQFIPAPQNRDRDASRSDVSFEPSVIPVPSDVCIDIPLTESKTQKPSFVSIAALDHPPSDYVYVHLGESSDPRKNAIGVYSLTTGQRVAFLTAKELSHKIGGAPRITSWDVTRDNRWLFACTGNISGAAVPSSSASSSAVAATQIFAYRITDRAATDKRGSHKSIADWNKLVLRPELVPRWKAYSVEERTRYPNRSMDCGVMNVHRSHHTAKQQTGSNEDQKHGSSHHTATTDPIPNRYANIRQFCRGMVGTAIDAAVREGQRREAIRQMREDEALYSNRDGPIAITNLNADTKEYETAEPTVALAVSVSAPTQSPDN